jgi:hypothetical protein
MADYPPIDRSYVVSYAANDRDYPVIGIKRDPRIAGYRVPEDLSPHPDSKRYPNHVFTGAQPASGDQIVTHIYEILPAPYVPFTRYDDDLGPIQGRRRSVKNEGQVAQLGPDQRVNYEAREGSAIVYTELEETWSIKTDDDGNSLFPVRDRDFYDASRGAVQERRQLFVPTGEEEGTLENINGVITQTSYEPYNEFLSVKIVQTYKVDGPQLIGKATDEARQLATVTTQRKGSSNYVPPNPTATRTVEVSSEDAESLVERIVEVPEVFGAEAYRKTREDITPQKFKAAQEDIVFEQTVEGTANPSIVLGAGEFVKSEEQVNKFTKRVSTTSRSITSAVILLEKVLTPQGQIGTRTLRLDVGDQSFAPSATLIDASVEALGDGRTVKTEVTVPSVFTSKTIRKTRPDLTPEKFRAAQADTVIEENLAGVINPPSSITLGAGEFAKSEEQVTEFVKRISTNTRDISAATDLTETIITPQGQVATRTLRLSSDPQSIQPDALLIDGSIEALGDQRTVKTEVRVQSIFDEKQISVRKPENIPTEFRATIPDVTEQSIVAGSSIPSITLDNNEIEKILERVSEFRIRQTLTTRDTSSYPSLLGQEYDDVLDVDIPFTRSIVSGSATPSSADVTPLSDKNSLSVAFDTDAAKNKLLNIHYIFPTQERISLPDKLISAKVIYTRTYGDSNGISYGNNYSKKLGSSAGVTGDLVLEIEQGYQGAVPAEIHIFFVSSSNISSITTKVNAQLWPAIKPKSHTVVISGASVTKQFSESSSDQGGTQDTTATASPVTTVVNIPPTIHGQINLDEEYVDIEAPRSNLDDYQDQWLANLQEVLDKAVATGLVDENSLVRQELQQEISFQQDLESLVGTVTPSQLAPTSPSSFPSGRFIVSSDVSLYRYGLAKVTAVVVDTTNYT